MADYLLEILSEEIPARMQAQAQKDLERLARERFTAADLSFTGLECFSGPRRLTLHATGLPLRQADRTEERRGPRASAPAAAVEGFLRTTGLGRSDLVERDGVLWAITRREGRETREVLTREVSALLSAFPWPKSMRSARSQFRWVRPIKSVLSVFDGALAPVLADGVATGLTTRGHRFMGAQGPAETLTFETYARVLSERFVVLDRARRRDMIVMGARRLCGDVGLELVEDAGLLEELCGLAEWPTPLLGTMDPSFLSLPPEVVRTSMRTHQKYFAVRDPATGALAARFVVVANIQAVDGGAVIAAGNAKVLSARLSDAAFFWREDLRLPLEDRLARLEGVVFQASLGSMRARVARLEALAPALAPAFGADPGQARLAARLCKCDLVTGMVGEFPELQGVMGGYYARAEGLAAVARGSDAGPWAGAGGAQGVDAVADAIRDHYRPQGPSEPLPDGALGRLLALSDKLDLLLSFFSIGEKPTGSRDPYALRRAALGIVRILLERPSGPGLTLCLDAAAAADRAAEAARRAVVGEVRAFILDRLKVALRDEGERHDVLDAVFAAGVEDLAGIRDRARALGRFIEAEAGASLLAGYRRAANILRAEERSGAKAAAQDEGADAGLASPPPPAAERDLAEAVARVASTLSDGGFQADPAGALAVLETLRRPIDQFFEDVLVNDSDPVVRRRRLDLLTAVRDVANRVADLSLLAG